MSTTTLSPLILAADPTTALGAATKQYVDASPGTGMPTTGGAFSGGISFGSTVDSSTGSVAQHIALYGTAWGFGVTAGRLNYNADTAGSHVFMVNGADVASISSAGNVSTAGVNCGSAVASSASDLSKHLALYSTNYGFGVTSNRLNYNAASGGSHIFLVNGADVATINATGVTAADHINSSDRRLKRNIRKAVPRDLSAMLQLCTYFWTVGDDKERLGLVAQDVRRVAPEYVTVGADGMLGIDKAGIALECVLGLAARVRELEARCL